MVSAHFEPALSSDCKPSTAMLYLITKACCLFAVSFSFRSDGPRHRELALVTASLEKGWRRGLMAVGSEPISTPMREERSKEQAVLRLGDLGGKPRDTRRSDQVLLF